MEFAQIIPPKLLEKYTDFTLVQQGFSHKTFKAISRESNQSCIIRVLDVHSQEYLKNRDLATTTFLQEALYTCLRLGLTEPSEVILKDFEVSGNLIAFVLRESCSPLSMKDVSLLRENIEQMSKGVAADLVYLSKHLKIATKKKINLQNIYHSVISDTFFLAGWAENLFNEQESNALLEGQEIETGKADIYNLGVSALEVLGIGPSHREKLLNGDAIIPEKGEVELREENLTKIIADFTNDISTHKLLLGMLHPNLAERISVHDSLHIRKEVQEPKIPVMLPQDDEGKQEKEKTSVHEEIAGDVQVTIQENASPMKESQTPAILSKNKIWNYKETPSLYWCSQQTNLIYISSINDEAVNINFIYEGAQLSHIGNLRNNYFFDPARSIGTQRGFTMIQPLKGTDYFISSISSWGDFSNFEILELSETSKKVYEHGDTAGGILDIAVNERRKLLGLLSAGETAYHLFSYDSMRLLKAQKIKPRTSLVQGLDFDPEGRLAACINKEGHKFIFNLDSGQVFETRTRNSNCVWFNKCRWSPVFALIATTHDGSTVEFTDPETIQVVNRVKGCMGEGVTWIDWHPQGELLALSHRDKFAAILDKRKDDIVQQFANVHTDYVRSVKWSACGKYLATSSDDTSVKIIEVSTGKVLVTRKSWRAESDRKFDIVSNH